MSLSTTNPNTGLVTASYDELTPAQVIHKIDICHQCYQSWHHTSINHRANLMLTLAQSLRDKRDFFANLISLEMGCPITQSIAEIEKCAYIAELFANKTAEFLQPSPILTDATESYVNYEPLGPILHVAPWNYPFYLALRPVIPAIMAGNTVLLKHASNVPQTSMALEAIFRDAGFPEGVFQSVLIGSSQVSSIIADERISLVTLIGSESAGSQIATLAGKYIKKSLMELGGSDPFIVFPDADIKKVIDGAMQSRFRNCGQSCNAAKRFIIHENIMDEFITEFTQAVSRLKIGDSLDQTTTLGPLATQGGLGDIQKQLNDSTVQGAQIQYGGHALNRSGYFFEPTILTHVSPHMSIWNEEVFGPIAPIMTFSKAQEAIELANGSRFGLGASIWTSDINQARIMIPELESGNVYINTIVRGDPKMPFGGVKKSGYGREFGEIGLKEFTNIKSVVIK